MSKQAPTHRRSVAAGMIVLAAAGATAFGAAGVAAAAGPPAGSTGAGPTGASTTTSTSTAPPSGNTSTKGTNGAGGANFDHAKTQLLTALSLRTSQLQKLGGDLTSNQATLGGDYQTLSGRISTEEGNVASLVTAVNGATKWLELNAARKSMLVDNRVFAVMTPQVFETIEADSVSTQVKGLQGDETGLQAAVNSIAGQPGYKGAENRYLAFVRLVNQAYSLSTGVAQRVLATTPQGWPSNEHVFIDANHGLLTADIDVARADYAATLIGLATGGSSAS